MRANRLISVVAACLALPAMAEVDLNTVNACIDTAANEQTNPALCIDQSHTACLDGAQETPAIATLCFTETRQQWTDSVGARMQAATANLNDRMQSVLNIETKYDLLSSLIQCDRMEELAIAATVSPGDSIALQKARCLSTASALAYVRLYIRVRDIN